MVELYTDRLVIRTIKKEDWANVFAINSDPSVLKYIREFTSEEDIKTTFEQRLLPWDFQSGKWLTLVIETVDTHEFVGLTGFIRDCEIMNRAEVGYLITPSKQGFGYGTESLKAVIDWGIFQFNIEKFIGHCAAKNNASAQVMKKCGFIEEGLLRENHRIGDVKIDEHIFGLLQSDIRS